MGLVLVGKKLNCSDLRNSNVANYFVKASFSAKKIPAIERGLEFIRFDRLFMSF